MAMNPYRVFRRPLLTEKSTRMTDRYVDRPGRPDYVKYTVEVDPKATKDDIRAAIETLFPEAQGKIAKINTVRLRGKVKDPDRNRRNRRFRPGRTVARKKAIITLRDGATIPQFEAM